MYYIYSIVMMGSGYNCCDAFTLISLSEFTTSINWNCQWSPRFHIQIVKSGNNFTFNAFTQESLTSDITS